MNRLQKALAINAIFSGISGIVLIILHRPFASIFGLKQSSSPFWMVGLALLYFTATIGYEIKKQRKPAVLWIIVQDLLWVVGSIILLIFNPFYITTIGNIIIAIVATIVLFMGINQATALKK